MVHSRKKLRRNCKSYLRACNFNKINTPPWVFFTFFKLHKWYQIAQRTTFKKYGLNLIIECNKTIVNYLDITLNLLDGTYKPYQKPENTIQYIHKESNHPPYIIKQIPIAIETRLSNHSSNGKFFVRIQKTK